MIQLHGIARATTSVHAIDPWYSVPTDRQRIIAMETIAAIDACGLWPGPVVTEVAPAGTFWEAEAEHQNYLDRNPGTYRRHFIRSSWILPPKQGE